MSVAGDFVFCTSAGSVNHPAIALLTSLRSQNALKWVMTGKNIIDQVNSLARESNGK
jgi:hypothetical protein